MKCAALGCKELTQRAAGNGVSRTYCKRHKEFKRRHGSTSRRSYSAKELRPFREAAERWTAAREGDRTLSTTMRCLDNLLSGAGRVEDAHAVRSLPPKRKAQVALARFREAGKVGRDLFTIALAVEAITRAKGIRDREYLHVQIAKVIHRVSSGTHPVTSGGVKLKPRWPRAEGFGMRLIGEWVRNEARAFELDGAIETVIGEAAQ